MLTEEDSGTIVKILPTGEILFSKEITIKKQGVVVSKYNITRVISDLDDATSAEQEAVLPEVKVRLAAAQGVVTKKEKPNKPNKPNKPKE